MIKKVLKKTIIAIVIVLTGIMICQKTPIIKNVKQKITKQTETFKEDITTIDVTGIELGKETQHEHIYKTMYDETNHWNECIICNKKENIIAHSLTTTWALGYESCRYDNSYTTVCNCGYSTTGHKPCVWDGVSYINAADWFYHIKKCSKCFDSNGNGIAYSYYLGSYGSGKIYDAEWDTEYAYSSKDSGNASPAEWCYNSNGKRLTCDNLGKCVKCGYNWTKIMHHLDVDKNTKIYCKTCNREFGTCSTKLVRDSNIPGSYTATTSLNLINGATFYQPQSYTRDQFTITQTVSSINSSKTQVVLTTNIVLKPMLKNLYENTIIASWLNINGNNAWIAMDYENINPDLVKPTITSIKIQNNDGDNDWSKLKTILVSGTENWTNIVNVEIKDDKGNSIYKEDCNVSNGEYSIVCTFESEADAVGNEFTVIVTDACANSTEQKFTVSKIDAIAPEITTSSEIKEEWSKEKNITFSATDQGIGNVQIAFNDVNDYQLATKDEETYSRKYKLTGDVYSPRKAKIFYKDELNNITSQEITIDKLDNTAPTITGASFSNNKLNIAAHDRHETEGEGSGVAKYRFITDTTKLENPEITTENSTEVLVNENMIIPDIYKVKYVYVVAEDVVGNISEVYEVKVPQLELISKVNVNEANGKGVIELDWSSYDIQNKYFVIYRKEENASEWEKIVSLEDRLTDGKYIDTLANDKTTPSTPTINIEGKQENNNIEITQTATDTGTKYSYYIEAYDMENTLIASSK